MSEDFEALKIVTQRLEKANLLYMVTGSVAANFYTVPRMTRDIDIVIELEPGAAETVMNIFSADFYVDLEMIQEAIGSEQMFNIIHNNSLVKIDFIIRKKTPYRELEFRRRKKMKIEEGLEVWVVAAEDLILSKLFWAKESLSELQLRDVKNILDNQTKLDRGYLEMWIDSLGLQKIFEKVQKW